MAVINNLKARFTGFYVNSLASRLVNCVGTYGTAEILNGGELEENTLQYDFKIQGLLDHTIKSIVVKSLLLNSDGSLATTKNMTLGIDGYGSIFRGNFETSDSVKTIISTEFNQTELQEENEKDISVVIAMNSSGSCYYGLHSVIINLQDIDYSISITFTGPNQGRTTSTIQPAVLLIKQGAVDVTFSKDPTMNYDSNVDTIEGRMYFKKDGIYVDGYQYGTVAPATELKSGIVKLSASSFETEIDPETQQEAIIAPTDSGVAATPLLVYNALATAKNYADELIMGIQAPLNVRYIDDNGDEDHLGEEMIFSEDFEFKKDTDKKLYIKWLELS